MVVVVVVVVEGYVVVVVVLVPGGDGWPDGELASCLPGEPDIICDDKSSPSGNNDTQSI